MTHSRTEADAMKLICPASGLSSNCIGSACMAWRWTEQEFYRERELWSRSANKRVNSAWEDDAWWRPIGDDKDADPPEAVGVCGMVLQP